MEQENEQAQEETSEQEGVSTQEESNQEETQDEDTLVLSGEDKEAYQKYLANKQKRQAIAERVTSSPNQKPKQEYKGHSIDTLFLIKDLAADEYVTLKDEADDLGVPLERYITSNSGKSVLDKMRAQKKSKEASVSLNSKSPVFKKFTQEDLNGMSAKELEKIIPR